MDFTIEAVQKMEKDLNVVVKQILKSCKISSVDEINHSLLMKPNKDPLASFVERRAALKCYIENC